MAIEANKELVRRYYDDWNEGRILETLDRYVAPDVVNRSATPEKGRGLANLRRTLERALAAMPDQRLTPEQIVAQYPVAVVRGAANEAGARAFIEWVLSPAGQAILERHGFIPVARTSGAGDTRRARG